MKKIISVVLCVVIILTLFSFTASAVGPSSSQLKCENDIVNAITNMKTVVDVSKYGFKCSVQNNIAYCPEVDDILSKIYYNHPELNFYVDTNGYTYEHRSGKMLKLHIKYTMDKETVITKRKYLADWAAYMHSLINPNWSDMQKTLFIHDYIVARYYYDNRYFTGGGEIHGMLEMFEEGTGVCQAYAYAMLYFLRTEGIKSYMAISLEDDHGWNVVKIDGRWYHVDATHDDPVFNKYYTLDSLGRVLHNKFLLSDVEINDGAHDNWCIPFKIDETIVCQKYTGPSIYKEALTSMVPMSDGYWYYLDYDYSNGGLRRTKNFTTSELVYSMDSFWNTSNNYYSSYYTGLFAYNGNLFFTDERQLYVYDPEESQTVDVFGLVDNAFNQGDRFFGFNMYDEKCYFIVAKDANFNKNTTSLISAGVCEHGHAIKKWSTTKEATMFQEGIMICYCDVCFETVEEKSLNKLPIPYGAGDTDGSGRVDSTDLAIEKMYLAGLYSNVYGGADFDKSGRIDAADLALLKLYLSYYG